MLGLHPARHHAVPFAFVLFSAVASAQSRKVNDPLPRAFGGHVVDVQVSPDGAWTVCKANPVSDVFQLFSIPTRDGTPIDLGANFDPYSSSTFQITADSRFVVYGQRGLHRVPIDGSRPPEEIVEGPTGFELVPDGSGVAYVDTRGLYVLSFKGSAEPVLLSESAGIHEFQVSPDGARVAYLAGWQETELHSVPLDGGLAPVELSTGPASEVDVSSYSFSADGGRIVFLARLDGGQTLELCSVPADGSSVAVKLNDPLPPLGNVTRFGVTLDARRVVYLADQEQDERFELYGVPIAGGRPPAKLNGVLTTGGDVAEFEITPDGRSVLYTADQLTDGQRELFLGAIEGDRAPRRLNDPLPGRSGIGAFRIRADGGRVVFSAQGPILSSLHSASLRRQGGVILLADRLSPYSTLEFRIGPDGRAVYRDDGLFSLSIDGGAEPRRLDDGGRIQGGFLIAPDGTVLYQTNRDREDVFELFGVPSDGSRAPRELGPDMDAGKVIGDVSPAVFSPDGKWALYSVQVPGCCDDTHDELYSVRLEPRSRPIRLFPRSPVYDDDLRAFRITPDSRQVVFTVGEEASESTYHLYSSRIDGRGEPVRLNHPAGLDYGLRRFDLGPDGHTVFYNQDGLHAGVYRVSSDGSSPPSALPGSFSASGNPPYFELDPGAGRVVVLSDPLVPDEYALSSIRADGSAPPVVLDEHATYRFQATPDGLRVVYLADPDESVYELFSTAIDGSTTPIRLSGALVPGGDVEVFTGFDLTPDGGRVVYLADAVTDGVLELFSAPTDGSAPPVRLDPAHALAAAQDRPFRLVPDGSRVVYRSDQGTLHSVLVAGASPPVRLDGASVAGGRATSFQISPDGARVVYRADQSQDEVFELHTVPIDAGASAIQITGPHVVGGDVLEVFRITPDGEMVVFVADHDTHEQYELYAAPIDRMKGARKLNGPLVASGDVLDGDRYGYEILPVFRIGPDSERVLYVADQDTDGVLELYESPIGSGHAHDGGRAARSP